MFLGNIAMQLPSSYLREGTKLTAVAKDDPGERGTARVASRDACARVLISNPCKTRPMAVSDWELPTLEYCGALQTPAPELNQRTCIDSAFTGRAVGPVMPQKPIA